MSSTNDINVIRNVLKNLESGVFQIGRRDGAGNLDEKTQAEFIDALKRQIKALGG